MTKMIKNYASYMDGAWVDAGSRALMEVENPATGEVFATVTPSSLEDVQDALESSRRAQKKWQQIPAFQRGQHLMSIVDKLALEREHFARLLGVINMVSGAGAEVGSALVESPITRLVSMTGSIRAGQAIYKSAANNITALILELGGKAPFIVLDDADMDLAVEAAVVARFANCGQVCICNEMVMVHEKVADEFAERVAKRVAQIRVGDPMKEVDMGPAVTAKGLDRVDQIVQDNIKQGAELLTGGKRPEGAMFEKGNWYEPTVLYPVKNDHEAAKNEIFGPVMPIQKVSGYEEALSRDYKKFMHAIDHLEVGTIFINRGIVGYIQGYHSGHKLSGVGGEDGVYGIEGYIQKRTIYLNY